MEITRNVTEKVKHQMTPLFPIQCKIVQYLNEINDNVLKTPTPCPPFITFLVATFSSDRKQPPP